MRVFSGLFLHILQVEMCQLVVDVMTKRELLESILEEVKKKIRMLDAKEERLFLMRDLVIRSKEIEVLNVERQELQSEIDGLMAEVRFLELDDTIHQ